MCYFLHGKAPSIPLIKIIIGSPRLYNEYILIIKEEVIYFPDGKD